MTCSHRAGCPRIEYGALILHECDGVGDYSIVADGFNLGKPVTAYEAIKALMVDGSHQSSPGHSNREGLGFGVRINFLDSTQRADLAEALELEAGKAFNEFRFYPGDDGPVTVLETFAADGGSGGWDIFEDINGYWVYPLTIPALPFARALLEQSLAWTDIGTKLDTLSATTGWSATPGSITVNAVDGHGRNSFSVPSGTTITKTFTIDRDFLWVWSAKDSGGTADGQVSALSAVSIGGTSVSSTLWSASTSVQSNAVNSNDVGAQRIIDISAWNGETVTVALTFTGGGVRLYGLWTLDYPAFTQHVSGNDVLRPVGIGVIDVLGSARTGCRLSFTAPAGGAFIYTAPDPTAALRNYGAGEQAFAHVTIASGGAEIDVADRLLWLPEGTHSQALGFTDPQPVDLFPNGIWPAAATGTIDPDGNGVSDGTQYAYPVDRKAAVTFFETPGAKNLISPTPALPEGYVGDAVHHEPHALYPGRCGFAVLDISGNPIATTVTYYPRNWIYAAH